MVAYARADAEVLLPLAAALKARLQEAGCAAAAEVEMRALPGVAWAGPVSVDRDRWLALADAARAEVVRLEDEMNALAPDPGSMFGGRNWNSPDQVKAAFVALKIELPSTDDAALAGVDHPLAGLVRDHRGAAKRAAAYGAAWVDKHVDAAGLVRPSWNQLGAESGRMSCSDPNLQQVPRGPEYRRCFVARPGCVLVKADYSQIELRIAARVADERVMIAAYQEGRDLHTLTAASILGKPAEAVAKADRQLAKAVNFGLLYGMGWRGLKGYAKANYGVGLTDAQAREYRDGFFRAYPGLKAWHRRVEAAVKRRAGSGAAAVYETLTLGGRRCVLPAAKKRSDGTLYPNVTEALNFPVQGTGADGLKLAIARLWETRAACLGAVPVLFCHDEVVLEAPEGQADQAAAWLEKCMVEAVQPLIDPVPVEVEVSVGKSWGG